MKVNRLRSVVFAFVVGIFAVAQNPIPNTPQGFQQQYHAVYESFLAHNDSALQSRLETFAIPAHWFKDSFAPDRASDLAAQYTKEFAQFKKRTAASFAGIDPLKARLNIVPGMLIEISTRRWTAAEDTMSTQRPPGLKTAPPQVQMFAMDVVALSAQYGRLTSSIAAFIYVDGAFRYFGRQGRPFWVNKP